MFGKSCIWGVIASICMFIVGILLFMNPIIAAVGSALILCIGIAVGGLYYLGRYFSSETKNQWDLALGVMNVVFAGWIMFIWFDRDPLVSIASMIMFIAIYMALTLFATGWAKFKLVSDLKAAGNDSTGIITFSAWMNMLAAVFFVFSPFVMTIVFEQIGGIYLIISGIILFIESIICFFKKAE